MSTITSLASGDSGSTSLGVINTNFTNLNTDKIEDDSTDTLTNKTIDGDLNTITDLAYSSIKSTSRSGSDVTLVTGTKGSTDEIAKWNVDGDLVTAGVSISTSAPTLSSLDTTLPTSQAVQEAITAQMLTKEFFVPVTAGNTLTSAYDTTIGDFATNTPDSAQVLYFVFNIPSNFTSLTSVKLVMIPDATETIQYDVDVDYGGHGELYNVNTATITDRTQSATVDHILVGSDLASALVNVQANDYVGMKVTSNTTQLRVLGLKVVYA
jgi:hypothetical protein